MTAHTRLFLLLCAAAAPAMAGPPPTADQLVDAAKQASGGAAWDRLKSWDERGKVHAGGLDGSYETWIDMATLRNANVYDLGPTSGGQGWDGKQAWTTDASRQVRIETSGETIAQTIQDAYRGAYGFFFPDRFPATREYAGVRTADGKSFEAVKVTVKGADPFEVWFDPETHLVAREVQLTGVQPHSFIFSGTEIVGGVTVPRQITDRVGGDPKYDVVTTTTAIEIAKPIPDSRFAPPPPPADDAVWPAGRTSVTIPFRLLNNHIYVMAAINGKPAVPFIFDTGATDILEASRASQLGAKTEGALPSGGFGDKIAAYGLAKVKSVSLGGLTLHDQVFGSLDLSQLNAVEGTDSAGLLGYEFAKRAVLTVDYAAGTLTFTRPDKFQPPAAEPVPFKFEEHTPIVDASIDGIPGEFEIDTGARSALTVMRNFAEANRLVAKYGATRTATVGYGVGGPSRALLARAGTLAIGKVTLNAPVTELVMDEHGAAAAARTAGNIGGDLLKRFTLTLDYGHQRLWLVPNALAAQPDVFDRSGLWIARAKDGTIAIADVAADSAAAKAGLTADDVIVAVDGTPASTIELSQLRDRFKAAPGTTLALTVKGKTGERHADLTLADQV
jgi:hypothetical protein